MRFAVRIDDGGVGTYCVVFPEWNSILVIARWWQMGQSTGAAVLWRLWRG